MNQNILLKLQADQVIENIKAGKRADGRKFDEYRKVEIKKNISENAEGSAHVKLGKTEVVAGIKMILGEPYPDMPDAGTISVGAELLALASPEYEAGPPRENSIELARVVDRGIRESKCLDFKDLCVVEGEKVWIVFIDFYVLNNHGNLFDAAAIASIASLLESKVPKLEKNELVKGEHSGKLKVSRKPILSTFAKIGNKVLLDPDLVENEAMTARFSVATTEDDYYTAFQKGCNGSFTAKEIDGCMETAMKKSKELRKLL